MSFKSTISEIAEVIMGQSPKGEDVNNDERGIPLLNGPTEFTSRYPVPVQYTTEGRKFSAYGDILFCVRGSTTGRMNYADQKYAIGRGIAAIRGKNGYPTPYVRAIIELNLDRLLVSATGSTFPNVGRELLLNFEVDTVSLDRAKEISKLIVSLEDKVEINRQTNQTLEAIAQAIFKSWFVDFEPIKAKMAVLEAGGTVEEAERAAMCAISGKDEVALTQLQTEQPEAYAELAQTAALFPSAMQDSELGDMPEGWNIHKFSKFALNVRESVKAENTKDHEIYIGLEHIDRVSLTLSRWGSGGDIESNKSAFIKGDVLFGKLRPYFHKVAIAPINGICSTDILVIRPKRSFYSAFVILQTFNSNFVEHANRRSTGTRMPRASWNDMADYVIASPDNDDIFLKFDERVNPLLNSLSVRNSESITLAELRDTLLPKLLSGEIDLSQAADMADEVSA